ncbi:MAG: dihydroorotase [Candidatus Wallbacteria bacterium]|nr:dihydroorotase [Candidatus Wallbacteria bacterium]
MKKLLIKNARVLSPEDGIDEILDIVIRDRKIEKIGKRLTGDETMDMAGLVVCPGFIDMHVHLREPGYEEKETVYTGTKAGLRGGFIALACMANTKPVADNRATLEFILNQNQKAGFLKLYPIGAVTKGQKGEELAEIADIYAAGAVAISDDGKGINSCAIMRRALEYNKMFHGPLIVHAEEQTLAKDGMMNEGLVASLLGFHGIPREAEDVIVARDLELIASTDSSVHFAHVSTLRSTALIREAKKKGLPVSAEVTPHHLLLTDTAVKSFDTNTKVNPPLRTLNDIEALCEGLRDGTIDAIASDHAPHTFEDKDCEYSFAPFGISGVETSVPLMLTYIVKKGVLTLGDFVRKVSVNPAKILHLPLGTIREGTEANLTVLDLEASGEVDPEIFLSKGRNTPFKGWKYTGRAVYAIVDGRVNKIG